MCNCKFNGRGLVKQCTWCYLGRKMNEREQMKLDVIQRSANVPLIEDDTDYGALIDDATKEYNEAKVIKVDFKTKQRMN